VLMAHTSILKTLKSVEVTDVACGIGNVVHNKGSVVVRVTFKNGRNAIFIGCHLAAHAGKVKERNEDYRRIRDEVEETFGVGCWDDADCIWWAGDLNYRLEGKREEVDCMISEAGDGGREGLLQIDQLTRVRMGGEAWRGMVEGKITFPPTYKFDKVKTKGGGGRRRRVNGWVRWEGLKYDSSPKRRVPSYTDRVLFKPYKRVNGEMGEVRCKCIWYESIDEDTGSDHKPVAGGWEVEGIM